MDNFSNQNEELTLKKVLESAKEWQSYLFSKWKIILLSTLIGAVIGLSYALIRKPIYQATLSFALEDEKSGGGFSGAASLANTFGFDLGVDGGGIFTKSNLTVLFKSRLMVEQTLLTPVKDNGKTISLAEMYIQNRNWRDKWEKKPWLKDIQFPAGSNRASFTRVHDSILGVIYNDLYKKGLAVAQKEPKISVITVDVFSTNEKFAKYFTEALSKNVSDFYVKTKSKKAKINMEILKLQTDSVRGILNGAITGVAIANDNVFGLNQAMNVRRAPSSRKQVDVQANTLILTELVKQTELAKVTLRRETPLIQVIDRPIFPLPTDSLSKFLYILIGGFTAGFFIVFGLIIKRILNQLK